MVLDAFRMLWCAWDSVSQKTIAGVLDMPVSSPHPSRKNPPLTKFLMATPRYPDSRRSSVSTPTLTPSSTSMTTSQQEKKNRFRLQSDLIESRSANPNEDNTEMPPVIVNHAIKACRDSRSFLEAEPYSDFIQKSLDSKKTAISYYEKTGRNDRLFYPNFKCEYVM